MKRTIEILLRLVAPPARLVALLLATLAAGGAWAIASVGDPFNWDNLSVNKGHNQSNTSAKWTITLNATDDIPAGSVVAVTEIALCSRNTYSGTTLAASDPRYLKIGEVYSEVVNGTEKVSGETLTANGTAYPKLSFAFSDGGVNLTVGTTYDMYLYNTGKASATASLGAKLVQSNDSKSSLVMTAQGGGYYPLGKITGTVVSTTPVYESSPTGTSINFSDLSWTLNGDSTSLPDDVSTSVLSVTLDDGAELAFDTDVSALALRVYGQSAVLDFDSTKEIAVSSTWDFSGMSGCVTLRNFPDTLSDAKVTLPAGGVRVEGTDTLSYLPYMSSVQTKHVDIAQSASITSGDGAYFKFVKSDYQFSSPGEFTFSRFAMGNKNATSDDATQTITQNGGSITVTGNGAPTSSTGSSILLAHWGTTCNLYTRGGSFTANNAAVRLGWDGTANWEIGGGQSAATATLKGIKAGDERNNTSSLTIGNNGVVNLGDFGIQFLGANATLNLSGGKIVASTATTIANSKSNGTVLTASTETEIDTTSGNVTISAPLSGSGSLNVTGGGTLTITGSGTASGGTIKATDSTIVLSGNGAQPGSTMYSLKKASGSSTTAKLEIRPGEGNTITLAPTHIIDSTDPGAQIIVGAGTTKIAHTLTNAGSGTFGGATVKVEDGGTLEVNNINWTTAGTTYGLEIGASSKFAVNALSTNSRPITMGEGATLEVSKGSSYSTSNGALKLDFRNGNGFTVNGNATIQATGEDAETPFINMTGSAAQPFNVASEKTLSVNANIKGTSALTKTGAGKLALNGYGADSGYTYTGTTTVSAGMLEINATQSGSAYSLAAGTTLKIGASARLSMPSITLPSTGTATIDVSALTIGENGVTLVTFATTAPTQADVDGKLTVTGGYALKVEDNALKAYPAVAQYNGTKYETVQKAIDAAVQAGQTYAAVTILDPNATCPEEYYIDTENGNVLTKCQAALVDTEGGTHYFATLQAAVDEIGKYLGFAGAKIYDYYEVYYGENVAIAIDTATPAHSYWSSISLKIKCAVGASVAVTLASTEYELTEGDADANGIVTYTKTDKATTYVWAGATSDSATTSEKNYARAANWRVGTSSGATATRAPGSFDTVVFGNGAYASTTASQSVAALQVSGAVTILGGGSLTSSSAITLGTGDSITITGTLSPTPTTSVADSYVKETGDTTKTYTVDAYNTVTFAGDNYTLGSVMTNGAAVAVSEGSCKVEDGAITFTVAPNSGYAVTGVTVPSGEVTKSNGVYSYTVTEDATITVTTVSTSLTIGAATVEYLADYSMAKTVSATVTAGTVLEGTTWTLKTNGVAVADATGTYANGTVTFGNISVTLGDSITYSIEASNGSTGTSAESAASTVGRVTGGWIVEDSAHTGTGATGVWATPVTYTDGVATITDANTYTPNKTGDGIVTLETVVKFGNAADPEVAVGDGAQAAVKIANGKFAVYGKAASNDTADWQSTTVDADVDATYTVKLVINYNTGTFTISVKKNGTETATALGGTWYLATAATKVSSIAYKGTGAFTSLNGSFISGDVGVTVDETGVAVSSDFISKHLAGKTVDEAAAALNPDATDAASNPEAFAVGGNGINYFKCYALGLDPTKADDKPIVDVTTDAEGKFVFTVKHPVYNEQGEITGYVAINAADNVSTTVTLKYGTGAASLSGSATGAAISPAEMFSQDGLNGSNVIYYKAEVSIGAK